MSCGLRLQSGDHGVNREGGRGVDGVAVKGFQGLQWGRAGTLLLGIRCLLGYAFIIKT